MTEKFDTDFEKILYTSLIDYASKTLNSEEIAPIFKSRSPNERRTIKQEILKRLEKVVKTVAKKIADEDLTDAYDIALHQKDVKRIITEIFREKNDR